MWLAKSSIHGYIRELIFTKLVVGIEKWCNQNRNSDKTMTYSPLWCALESWEISFVSELCYFEKLKRWSQKMLAARVEAYENRESYTRSLNFTPKFNTRVWKKNTVPSIIVFFWHLPKKWKLLLFIWPRKLIMKWKGVTKKFAHFNTKFDRLYCLIKWLSEPCTTKDFDWPSF